MLAGVLAPAGYYMGGNLWPAREANPKGFFEDVEMNWINEQILAAVTPRRPSNGLGRLYRSRPALWQRWLADVPVGTEMPATTEMTTRIEHETAKAPFCFKDPRFCYTLPAWRPYVGDAAFLCIFRHPAETVASILKECREASYLRDLRINRARALAAWTSMYRHVLDVHSASGDWLFAHYEQVLDGSVAARLEALVGVSGDWQFPERALRRSAPDHPVDGKADGVYAELCRRAGYDEPGRPARRCTDRTQWFEEAPLALSTRNIFDLGVVDLERDGRLAVFTTNHNSRQTLLANRGDGVFDDVVDQLGLHHDPAIAGWDHDVTPPPRRRDGIYLYRRWNTTVVQRVGTDPPGVVELRFCSDVEVGQRTNATTDVLPDGAGTLVRCDLRAGAQVDITPDLVGAPMAVRIDPTWPLDHVFVGSGEENPRSHDFTLLLRDRHGMAWLGPAGNGGMSAFVGRGGLKGRLDEFPSLVTDELLVRRGDRLEDAYASTGLEKGWCRSRQVAWVNLDGTASPALFVACLGAGPRLYQRTGQNFVDMSDPLGMNRITGRTYAWADINGDGRDELLAVDGDVLSAYLRTGDGAFARDQTVRLRNHGGTVARMAIADWRGAGAPDVFAPSPSGNTLVLNDGGRLRPVDPGSVGLPAAGGITAHWVDYDNDGLVDLHVLPGGLFRQQPDGRFEPTHLLDDRLPSPVVDARAAWFDAANSGARDLLVAVSSEPKVRGGEFAWRTTFLRNRGASGHWLQVDLVGCSANRDAIGAAVKVHVGDQVATQWVGDSEGSHYSQGHYRLYFGLGDHPSADRVEVRWPDGSTDELGPRGDELVRVVQRPADAGVPA